MSGNGLAPPSPMEAPPNQSGPLSVDVHAYSRARPCEALSVCPGPQSILGWNGTLGQRSNSLPSFFFDLHFSHITDSAPPASVVLLLVLLKVILLVFLIVLLPVLLMVLLVVPLMVLLLVLLMVILLVLLVVVLMFFF